MARELVETGSVLDGFLVGEKIHVGGMAELWSVTKQGIDAPLLMKLPQILDGQDAEAIVGFEMEQMILPRLTGPHVPRVYGVGDFSSRPYIVMERLPGASLFQRLAQAPLPPAEVAALGAKIASALHDLHRQRVLHLDVKPSNVMIKPDGSVAFVDFGLSRHLDLPDLLAEEFRLPLGTAPYMAPEQIFRVRDDPRSDIFALGVLLYHLAVGERPFGFPRSDRALKARLWSDPEPPRALSRQFPAWLQEAILRCLQPMPADRPQSADLLAFDLRHPEQAPVGALGAKTARDGFGVRLRRRIKTGRVDRAAFTQGPKAASAPAQAPIIMAAVDLRPGAEALAQELRRIVGRTLALLPQARLACVFIVKQSRVQINYALDAEGRSIHLLRLAELKEWARPLGLHASRLTVHALESADVAAALIDFASENDVDQILIGARGVSTLRRYLGTVAGEVVTNAPCTVTVVRLAGGSGEGAPALAQTPVSPAGENG
jgi:nucleotide-binding universal stress UspA family protein